MGQTINFGATDTRFEGVQVISVYTEDDGGISARFVAESAAALDPLHEAAGDDGWVRNLRRVAGQFNTMPRDPARRADVTKRLERWRDEGTLLCGMVDLEYRVLALKNPLLDGDIVATFIMEADLDRA